MNEAESILESIVNAIVENKKDVRIETQTDDMGILLTLHVSKPDMGKVIGKSGETVKAIRTIIRVVGMQEKARINLKIAEPEGSSYSY